MTSALAAPQGGQLQVQPGHVPLRIEWQLASPWVPPALGLHLDGLLAHVLVQRALATAAEDLGEPSQGFDDVIANLPLAKFVAGERFVWTASLLVPEVVGSSRRHMTTKTPSQAIADLTAEGILTTKGGSRVDTVRGFYKAGSQYITLQAVRRMTAWCVGDPDAIADLLSDVHALGSKTRLGHGQIQETAGELFSMEEDERALTWWQYRHMPVQGNLEGKTFVPVQACLQSPYWRRDRVVSAWRPNDA